MCTCMPCTYLNMYNICSMFRYMHGIHVHCFVKCLLWVGLYCLYKVMGPSITEQLANQSLKASGTNTNWDITSKACVEHLTCHRPLEQKIYRVISYTLASNKRWVKTLVEHSKYPKIFTRAIYAVLGCKCKLVSEQYRNFFREYQVLQNWIWSGNT